MAPPTSQLCLSCSSTLLPRLQSSSTSSHFPLDNKLRSQYYTTPCCSQPICSTCLQRNPRLREWNPCLWCASGVGAVKGTGAGKSGKASKGGKEGAEEGDERFEIGGDSDLDDEVEDVDADDLARAPPPPYQEDAVEAGNAVNTSNASQRDLSRSRSRSPAPSHRSHPRSHRSLEADRQSIAHTHVSGGDADVEAEQLADEEEAQEQEEEEVRRHTVKKGDTVRSLALKYGIDPYDLIKINSLPHSALHSNPNLLQTRKTILLSKPKGGEEGVDGDRGVVGVEEDERRREERRVKRFQILTKTPDPGIAKAYLAIQSLDDSILTSQPGSTLFDADADANADANFNAAGSESYESRLENKEGEKEKVAGLGSGVGRKGGNSVENRAVDKYYDDDEWAKQVEEEMKQVSTSSSNADVGKGWLAGLTGGKGKGKGKGNGTGFKKGEVVQGAPWIESR